MGDVTDIGTHEAFRIVDGGAPTSMVHKTSREFEPTKLPQVANFLVDVTKHAAAHARGAASVEDWENDHRSLWGDIEAVEPMFPPEGLAHLVMTSNSLRQCLDAIATNVDGFGHRLEPVIDLDAPDVMDVIRQELVLEREKDLPSEVDPDETQVEAPSDDEVEKAVEMLRRKSLRERRRADDFFKYASVEQSFVDLRKKTRFDLEAIGYSGWEVIRDRMNHLSRLVYVRAVDFRPLRLTDEDRLVEVEEVRQESVFSVRRVTVKRPMRRFVVRKGHADKVYLKSYGDPRTISQQTGKTYESVEALKSAEPGAEPGNEMLYFAVHNPLTPVGVPRWVGNLLSVLGSREMEYCNFTYFENKTVPPLLIMVSGGQLADGSADHVTEFMKEEIKGRKNFWKALVLEGIPAMSNQTERSPHVVVDAKPLTGAQEHEQLFGVYDTANRDKVGESFRLPRILRGISTDFNRACYSEDTETLTERGWRRYWEIGDGERIATINPETGALEYHEPKSLHVYPYKGEMVHFTSRGVVDVLVTPEHKMWLRPPVDHRPGRTVQPWRKVRADEVPTRFEFQCVPSGFDGGVLEAFTIPFIEQGSRHKEPGPPIPPDLMLEFLGYYLSDGGLLQSPNAPSNFSVFLRQKKGPAAEKFAACVEEMRGLGFPFRHTQKRDGTHVWRASHKSLWTWLRRWAGGYSEDRRIPDEFMGLCERQSRILYDALMLGDGSVDSREDRTSRAYYSKSTVLAGQVQVLAFRLGYRAAIGPAERCWRVVHSEKSAARLDRDERNVRRVDYDGVVYCFEVPNHLFVTRRNGKIGIHGNTADAARQTSEEQVFQPERDSFDFAVNRWLLPDLGVSSWGFVTNAPVTRDPETMSKVIERLVKVGVLLPAEGRELAGDIFNREFPRLRAAWVRRPLSLTLAGIPDAEAAAASDRTETVGEPEEKSDLEGFGEDGPEHDDWPFPDVVVFPSRAVERLSAGDEVDEHD